MIRALLFLAFLSCFLLSNCSRPLFQGSVLEKPLPRPKPLPPDTVRQVADTSFAPAPEQAVPKPLPYPAFRVARGTVRVYLGALRTPTALQLEGVYTVYDANGTKSLIEGKTTASAKAGQVTFSILSGQFVMPVILRPGNRGSTFKFNNQTYRGSMTLRLSASGGPILINELSIEDYLKGVVPYEIGKRDTTCFEALKVQAIVARTYTYSRLGSQDTSGFDVYPDESDQMYNGMAGEYALSNMAVDSTRDIVVCAGDSLIQTFYYSTSSGKTANIEEVWPDRGYRAYLRTVDDSIYNTGSKYFSWTEEWDGAVFEKIINRNLPDLVSGYNGKGKLQKIEIESFTTCGRVKILAVTLSGETYRVYGDKVRWLLRRNGADRPILRSASFTLEVSKNGAAIRKVKALGRGFGHGVGMSQMGAIGMALAGKKAEEIIPFYYTGVTLAIARY